jgi:hypothetical protein
VSGRGPGLHRQDAANGAVADADVRDVAYGLAVARGGDSAYEAMRSLWASVRRRGVCEGLQRWLGRPDTIGCHEFSCTVTLKALQVKSLSSTPLALAASASGVR